VYNEQLPLNPHHLAQLKDGMSREIEKSSCHIRFEGYKTFAQICSSSIMREERQEHLELDEA
jgi:hypothetical protein